MRGRESMPSSLPNDTIAPATTSPTSQAEYWIIMHPGRSLRTQRKTCERETSPRDRVRARRQYPMSAWWNTAASSAMLIATKDARLPRSM